MCGLERAKSEKSGERAGREVLEVELKPTCRTCKRLAGPMD
jgi:hypothetical protein